ncbi:phospholipase C type enzyme [Lignoscripta atroalba]|nr:phospholipase C type enzyme [Lignoscripta atroalba]
MNTFQEQPNVLNVITLNCWGLKFIAKLRKERLDEIGRRLATANPVPSIIGLQECWTQEDYKCIREHTKDILPYGKFYYSGIFGGGLAILSRWPIEESSMFRYPLNGRPTAFFRGDWFVGKGVACAKIRIGPSVKDVVEVFCTHLHAPYEREPHDSYICHRTAQAWEIAKLMCGAAEKGHLVIGLGDFNMVPLSLAHRLITTHSPVQDVWRVLHPDSSLGAAVDDVEKARDREVPTAQYNVTENGATCDSVLNTWRWTKEQQKRLSKGEVVTVEGNTPDSRAKRLDYIFFGSGAQEGAGWYVQHAKLGMIDRHPSIGCSLSDHFSVEASFAKRSPTFEQPDTKAPTLHGSGSKESQSIDYATVTANGNATEKSSVHLQTQALPVSTYDEILSMISTYNSRERRQRRLRLSHFVASVNISVGCLIAIWWSPHYSVSFVLMLVSTLGLAAGVVDGLIGGLFVGSELRALKEFEWEIRNARATAGGDVES